MLLEKTQRRVCRLLFLLGCVLPTLAVAGYTARRLDPGYRVSLLATASQQLGFRVESSALETPRPGVYVLNEVRLIEGMDGEAIAKCDTLRVESDTNGWRFSAKGIAIENPNAASGVISRLVASDLLATGTIEGLRLDESTTLHKATATLGTNAEGLRRLVFACDDGTRFEAVSDDHASNVAADSGEHGIPTDWLPGRPLSPLDESGARFTGRFIARLPRDGGPASGAAVGRIELRSMTTPQLEAKQGSIRVEDLAWGNDRLVRFVGQVDLRDGRMSRPLVYGACCHLAMEPLGTMEARYAAPTNDAWFPFTQLACEVELDAKGIVLVAGCGEIDGQRRSGAIAHAIVEHEGVALLREPRSKTPLPTQRLVNAWHPDDPAELPATAAAIEMANRLPAASTR